MTYIIGLPCVDVKDRACVEECPVDCIYEGNRMLYIHPEECVDCGACEPVCPVEAIRQTGDCVQLNESLCIGCNLCAVACPFGAIQSGGSRPVAMATSYDTYIPSSIRSSNPSTSAGLRCFGEDLLSWEPGVRSIAVKCDLCEFRAEGPACVSACPSQSLSIGNDTPYT